jgi:hypothetical protein
MPYQHYLQSSLERKIEIERAMLQNALYEIERDKNYQRKSLLGVILHAIGITG